MTENFTVKRVESIGCRCGGDLRALQIARTTDERIFVVGTCENCKTIIPVEVDELIANLYQANFARNKSNKVN